MAVSEQSLLSATIETIDKLEHFVRWEDNQPIVTVHEPVEDQTSAESIYQSEINTPLNDTKRLFRFTLVPVNNPTDGDPITRYMLLMIIDHAITDGKSGEYFTQRLFEHYEQLCADQPIDIHAPQTAHGIEHFFSDALRATDPDHQIDLQQQVIDQQQPDSIISDFVSPEFFTGAAATIVTRQIQLNQTSLATLKKVAAQHHISLNSLLNAAIAQSIYQITEREKLTLATKFAVDCRALLSSQPNVDQDENRLLSCRASTYDGFFRIGQETPLFDLADTIQQQQNDSITLEQMLKNVYIYSTPKKKIGSNIMVVISNIGRCQLRTQWPTVKIHNYFAHGIAVAPFIGFTLIGFDDALTINLYTLDPWIRQDKAVALITRVTDTLTSIVESVDTTGNETSAGMASDDPTSTTPISETVSETMVTKNEKANEAVEPF